MKKVHYASRSKLLSLCVTALVAVVVSHQAHAIDLENLWSRDDQRGHDLLEQGRANEAAAVFRDPQWRGISHYRAGNYEGAQEEFAKTQGDAALYNQGTTAARAGDYQGALETLEKLVEQSPDHEDAKHNLDIVRKLLKNQPSEQSENSDQSSESEEENQQEDGEEQSSDGESGDQSDQSDGQSSADDNGQQNGELSADPNDAGNASTESEEAETGSDESSGENQNADEDSKQNPDGQDQKSHQAAGSEDEPSPEQDDALANAAGEMPAEMSEDEQATEQWLRRIPDDPSQLLRNKIRLNHMIEHADVHDMKEPW